MKVRAALPFIESSGRFAEFFVFIFLRIYLFNRSENIVLIAA